MEVKIDRDSNISCSLIGRVRFPCRPGVAASRITARVRLGGGKVVDIEREVELGTFPPGTINDRIEQRLIALAMQARAFNVTSGVSANPPSGSR